MKLGNPDAIVARAVLGLLHRTPAHSFPEVSSLSSSLTTLAPEVEREVQVDARIARQFATASIDAWLRAVHSFLVSTALTDTSPIWASVAGYYSSHYTIRALAHLLGVFCLYKKKYVVRLLIRGGNYYCIFTRKGASDREHKTYWRIVSATPPFSGNPLFPSNHTDSVPSDVGHRDRANYADHLRKHYLSFHIVDEETTKLRIEKISKMAFSEPPIPNREKFPDVDSVQIVSYHRIVQYRRLVDEIIESKNRFWSVNRDPTFASGYLTYQLIENPLSEIMDGY